MTNSSTLGAYRDDLTGAKKARRDARAAERQEAKEAAARRAQAARDAFRDP